MSLREHAWKGLVAALSWIVALVVLACVAIYVVADAGQRHSARRAALKAKAINQDVAATSLQMELAS